MAERRPRRQQRNDVRQARLPRSRNAPDRPRRISRAQREAKRQKLLYIGIAAVAGLLVAILIGTYVWTDVVRPRQVLASVNGTDISREDYWQTRGMTLIDQIDQYSYLAGVVGGDQASQYQNAAVTAQTELDDLWGSTDVNQTFLQQMVDDQLFVQYASTQNVTITDEDVDTFILNRFAPEEAPLIAPTVEPTLIPERASWATQTAVVTAPQPTEPVDATGGTPAQSAGRPEGATGSGTPVPGSDPMLATPITTGADPAVAATPETGTPAADAATPAVAGTPATSPAPDAAQARATAEASYQLYRDRAFDSAQISEDEYREWVALPALSRERVTAAIQTEVGQSGPQVHGAHILLSTQELATQTYDQITAGANFAELARTLSEDTATGPNGGDLGWFAQADVDPAIWEATTGLTAGQITAPFQTNNGWEIVQVIETATDRAYTDQQLTIVQEGAVDEWLAARAAEADVSGDIDPTPTPGTAEFDPPVNAPTGVAATESPATPVTLTGTPAGTPIAAGTPVTGTPLVASPAA